MKQQWLVSLGIAATIALSACSGTPATPTVAPAAPTSASAAATTAPQATTAPSTVPTTVPTVVPTTVPTAAATPTAEAQPTTAATATPSTAVAANTPVAGGPEVELAEVQKVAQAWSQVKSFRIKSEAGSESQFTGEFVAPDKSHVTVGAGGQTFEFIQIGQDSYTKINGTWTKHTGATSTMTTFDPNKVIAEFNDSKQSGTKLTKGAVENVNGVKCQEWVSTDADGKSTSICVGVDNSLPVQVKSADGKSVIDFYDYNAPITIQAPI